jgi:hypothetical protein
MQTVIESLLCSDGVLAGSHLQGDIGLSPNLNCKMNLRGIPEHRIKKDFLLTIYTVIYMYYVSAVQHHVTVFMLDVHNLHNLIHQQALE